MKNINRKQPGGVRLHPFNPTERKLNKATLFRQKKMDNTSAAVYSRLTTGMNADRFLGGALNHYEDGLRTGDWVKNYIGDLSARPRILP